MTPAMAFQTTAPASATPQELSRLALERGLLLSGKAAGGFGDEIAIEEAARVALEAANYQALQKELRTRAPLRPDAAMAALGSPTRRGSAALPGPLPGMAAQARRPAQLRPLVEEDEEEEEEEDDDDDEGEEEGSGGSEEGGTHSQ